MKKLLILFTILAIAATLYFNQGTITGLITHEQIPQEYGNIDIYFCPHQNCEQQLIDKINAAQTSIHCAFFDLNLQNTINALENRHKEIEVKVIVDADHKEQPEWAKEDTRSAYMHNKFCIFDDKEIFTGSMNPTFNGATKNNNNILFITSKTLAKNYEDEFQSMWNNDFGNDNEVQSPQLMFNDFLIENYFCPEDNCEEHILETLHTAEASIHFMTFSFTSDPIGDLLLQKSKSIEINGIFEKRQSSQYSEYEKLQHLNVLFDTNPATMHHKVFIIDEKIVITGSMNPSNNGNTRNDENILVIHNEEIAQLFVQEFNAIPTDQA